MIKVGRINESSDYEDFKKACQANPTYKKAAAICKKYGYELSPSCYVEVGKTGKLYVNFGVMYPPRNSYRPEIHYSRDRFQIQTTAYGSLELDEHAKFIEQVTAAHKMVAELSKLDLTTLHQIPMID